MCYSYNKQSQKHFLDKSLRKVIVMRILLAEDEKELSRALDVIMKHNKYAIDIVDNGQDAYDYIMTGIYDIVILDLMLPVIDGITVLRSIRGQGNMVPVIIITAKSEVDDKVLGLDAGADDYLTKPFDAKELLARVRALLRRRGDIAPKVVSLGNLILNYETYELSTPKDSIKLPNKEFQVMEVLINNPRVVISFERFLEKIWGFEADKEPNVVWVHVAYLRRKLIKLDADVEIRATRNVGYALVPKDE